MIPTTKHGVLRTGVMAFYTEHQGGIRPSGPNKGETGEKKGAQ
jgi:hypothetical protein